MAKNGHRKPSRKKSRRSSDGQLIFPLPLPLLASKEGWWAEGGGLVERWLADVAAAKGVGEERRKRGRALPSLAGLIHIADKRITRPWGHSIPHP